MRLTLAISVLALLTACSRPYDDGMSDLWEVVKYQQEQRR